MRFVLKTGTDPIARADAALLAAMGLPGGGSVRVGATHTSVAPGEVPSPNALLIGPIALSNSGLSVGDAVDVTRAVLPGALRVEVSTADGPLDGRHLARALQGRVVTEGDRLLVRASYGAGTPTGEIEVGVVGVQPGGAGIVGNATIVHDAEREQVEAHPQQETPSAPTTATALLAGLDAELEALTGWISLLTGADDLPSTWGLPRVAGILLSGPIGCGKSELVTAAANASGAVVREVSLELVFKPERLLAVLERAVKTVTAPGVIFVDRLDAVAGPDAMFQAQVTAILRWFLDAVAERPRVACVIGTSAVDALAATLATSPLLPRTLSVPPPDTTRRRMLFEAALGRVPADDIDYDALAARTAGFSGADILAVALEAGARIAAGGGLLDQDTVDRAVRDTNPSLGATGLGEVPLYGFDRVADLTEVKQRLTEAVIWQMRDPDRFERLGIEPPRGLLLHGPPGTGKTFVIRALAHDSGAAFFPVKGAELLDKWVGESERAVREVFARSRAVAPSILFFDEIDALAPVRGSSASAVTDSVVAALLTEMDGVADRGDVFVVGATNRRDLVDPALLRAGRLEVHLHLGLPEAEARAAFLAIAEVPFAADVDLDAMVAATGGRSFADLSGLLREAALQALRRDPSALSVTNSDLTSALRGQSPLESY